MLKDKKNLILVIAITIVMGIFTGFLMPSSEMNTVTLIADGKCNEESKGGEVWLSNVLVNGEQTSLRQYVTPKNKRWKYIKNSVVYVDDPSVEQKNLTLSFVNAESVELVFSRHGWSGIVGIQDGDEYTELDLYGNSSITYEVKNLPTAFDYSLEKGLLGIFSLVILGCLLGRFYVEVLKCKKRYGIYGFAVFCVCVQSILLFYCMRSLIFLIVLLGMNAYVFGGNKERREQAYAFLWGAVCFCWGYQTLYLNCPYLPAPWAVGTALMGICFVLLSRQLETIKGIRYLVYTALPVLCFGMIELTSNINERALDFHAIGLNIAILALLMVGMGGLFGYKKIGWYITPITFFVISTVNFYVIRFKKFALMPSDILQIRTAAAVAGDYKYVLSDKILMGFLLLLFILVLIYKYIPENHFGEKKWWWQKGAAVFSLVLLFGWYSTVNFEKEYRIIRDNFDSSVTYSKHGFVLSFMSYLQTMYPQKPEGYSDEQAREILARYSESKLDEDELPTIIAIMNESFSDLGDLGDLGDFPEDMWYMDSYSGFLEKGRTYVSVRGGGTCNSEFEFLTGNSMQYFADAYPYTQYNFNSVSSLVSNLKEQGYRTIAFHPANPENYKRKSVYEQMGFEKFVSYHDYDGYERIFLDRTTDLDGYKKIIEAVDSSDEPQFIFNVTIQNHGEYNAETLNSKYPLLEIDPKYNSYDDVRMYLTLMNESNKALEYLIQHFEKEDKPVIICFFGDHQPGCLDASFEKSLFQYDDTVNALANDQRHYGTPYFIWSNYDVGQDEMLEHATSPNYLATRLLDYAGLNRTPYELFLEEMQQDIPALNRFGYLGKDGIWYRYEEESPYKHWINEYEILQYYNMFGDK